MVRSVASPSVGEIGSGFTSAPSSRVRAPCRNGVKTSGVAIEARIASNRVPSRNQTSSPDSRSVATAVKASGSASMAQSPISSRSTPMMRSPLNSPSRPKVGSSRRSTCMRSSANTHSA